MVLQLKGIHTGALGGGQGDLAMLIDVRRADGEEISRQLRNITPAESAVNAQRAQLWGMLKNTMSCASIAGKSAALSRFPRCGICEWIIFQHSTWRSAKPPRVHTPVLGYFPLSAAESHIRDTDMALEMMRFTSAKVLQQAGISMLAQANQLPASILQLLQ